MYPGAKVFIFWQCKIPLTWTVFVADPIAAKTLLLKTGRLHKLVECMYF